ncbi:3161_t:CDS:10 [Ambispora leptoticha]|uniref:3161_t:CDS:1 n=1 Tax=Ambispora leptoticha TaxID=144679 RepID=A0A9N9CKV7_9GLOM|nr:3161_t:CDS:10 [Ambispora leptoticha]
MAQVTPALISLFDPGHFFAKISPSWQALVRTLGGVSSIRRTLKKGEKGVSRDLRFNWSWKVWKELILIILRDTTFCVVDDTNSYNNILIRGNSTQNVIKKYGNYYTFARSFNSSSVTFVEDKKGGESDKEPNNSKKSFFNSGASNASEEQQQVEVNSTKPKSKASAIVQSILHGSVRAKEEERQTHSKLVARGKYVHELVKHKIKPEYVDDYIALISEHYPRIANDPANQLHLSGSWQTEVGDLDSFFHLWEYNGYTGYQETKNQLKNDQIYQDFEKKIRPMIQNRTNQICLEFAFWATSPPAVRGGVYELRSYGLKPGHLLEWENYWHKGLECRRQFCEPVGAWFSQLGVLNYVHHMWNYPDLETRKTTREQAWQVDGWADTVYKTGNYLRSAPLNARALLEEKLGFFDPYVRKSQSE